MSETERVTTWLIRVRWATIGAFSKTKTKSYWRRAIGKIKFELAWGEACVPLMVHVERNLLTKSFPKIILKDVFGLKGNDKYNLIICSKNAISCLLTLQSDRQLLQNAIFELLYISL